MRDLVFQIISNPIYIIIVIICLIIIIFNKKIYTFFVGKAGEHWAKDELNRLDKNVYTVLNDIMVKVDDKYHQIDHIVVSVYGVFVIETKQYNGFITGNKYDLKWIRHSGNKKYYYTNPIRQNYGHVKALSSLLGLEEDKLFNIVYIPSKAKLNIKDGTEIVRAEELVNKIKQYDIEIISDADDITKKLASNNIKDKNLRKEHIESINKEKLNFNDNMCPKCGGDLVKRNGKFGEFYGCSNFPKCKYTKKISE